MKRLLFTLLLLASAPLAQAANPSFDSFVTNDFIKIPPYIYLRHTNSSGTNVFNGNVTIYTNSTINIDNSTNIVNNSYTIYTNSSVTLNGTNLATINPTIGRIPYNADGTNFLDSSLYYIDPDTVGANELRTDLMVFNPAPTQSLPTGVNLLNPFEVSFMPLAASTTTPTDTQIRLSTGNGVGALLVLQNYNGDAFELLNGDALWDDPAAHVYLSGGDWKPDTIGQAMLLIGTSQGWAEIGRFGGSTNVVTQDLWQYSGGYLQPVDLTQPLFWTNSVTWGSGTTNSLERSGQHLVYTNGANGALFKVQTPDNTVGIGTRASDHHGTITSASGELFLTETVLSQSHIPIVNDTYSLGGPTLNTWWLETGALTNYVKGFAGATSSDYARGAIYHTGTNGAWMFDSQAAGTAGTGRPFQFEIDGTNTAKFGGTTTTLGFNSGSAITSGHGNIAIGDTALATVTTAGGNVAIGSSALQLTTSSLNTAVGSQALSTTTTGGNSAFGNQALQVQTTGFGNTGIGELALGLTTTGNSSVALGESAGYTNVTGSKNTFVGYLANPINTNDSNSVSIGYKAFGMGSNTTVIGDTNMAVIYLGRTVGWFRGSGSPEGAVTASIGSFYSRTDGGAGTSFYVKETGAGNTGWVGK